MQKKEQNMNTYGKFIGINKGIISNCYSVMRANFSFAGENKGEIVTDISDKNIWQKTKSKKRPLMFVPHNWYAVMPGKPTWTISNKKELMHFAQMVNIGDSDATNANVKLLKNILHKQKINTDQIRLINAVE